MTTLHINVCDDATQKVLAFLDSLSKKGILKGLGQFKNGEVYSSDELLKERSDLAVDTCI